MKLSPLAQGRGLKLANDAITSAKIASPLAQGRGLKLLGVPGVSCALWSPLAQGQRNVLIRTILYDK